MAQTPMDIRKLIDLAADACGSKAALAREMDKKPPRVSEWYRSEQKPDAHEIAYMAERAGLPVLETVAEIESQLDPRYSNVWKQALEKLKSAGVAASSILILQGVLAGVTPENSHANQRLSNLAVNASQHIDSTLNIHRGKDM